MTTEEDDGGSRRSNDGDIEVGWKRTAMGLRKGSEVIIGGA